jgi:hypothetical protein
MQQSTLPSAIRTIANWSKEYSTLAILASSRSCLLGYHFPRSLLELGL